MDDIVFLNPESPLWHANFQPFPKFGFAIWDPKRMASLESMRSSTILQGTRSTCMSAEL